MNISRLSILFGTLLFVCGCASTDKIVLDATKRAPTTTVDIYKDRQLPTLRYKEIAELSYLGPREEELKALNRFIGEAKRMGGNGVIFTPVYAGTKGGGTLFQTEAWVFKASVIAYSQNATQSGGDSVGDQALESKIIGHWQSVSINTKTPGASKLEFTFLPGLRFSQASTESGKVYPMNGRYFVRNGKLNLLRANEASANPDEGMDISLTDDSLQILFRPVGESVILKRIP